jgi:hypothetical protein
LIKGFSDSQQVLNAPAEVGLTIDYIIYGLTGDLTIDIIDYVTGIGNM